MKHDENWMVHLSNVGGAARSLSPRGPGPKEATIGPDHREV